MHHIIHLNRVQFRQHHVFHVFRLAKNELKYDTADLK